ncbi:MAG: hypothetical protein ACRDZ7_05780 [Acidimicrobiia bacterium]
MHPPPLSFAVLIVLALVGCSGNGDDEQVVLPEDPCALLSADDVAATTEATVTKTERVASIDQIVAVQDRGGTADDVPTGDRRLCSYTTTSRLRAITVFVPKASGDAAKLFTSRRGGHDESVDGVGDDAYLAGGASLHVLVGVAAFSIQVQDATGATEVRGVLTKLAKRAIDRLAS